MHNASPMHNSGRFELWRRLLLLLFFAIGMWLFMYASPAPLVRMDIVDFAREQERETSGHFVTDQQVHLAALPLQDYIGTVTDGALVELEGTRWNDFLEQAGAAAAGSPSPQWEKRIPADDLEWGRIRSIFFRPEEEPVAGLLSHLVSPNEPVHLKGPGSAEESLYLRMRYISFSHDNFSPGSGYTGINEPPSSFFRPYRPYSYLFFLAGLLLYFFLPKPRRAPEAMHYSRGSVIGADLASVILFVPFFGLPLLIMGGSVQALTGFLPATLIFWGMALFSLWLVFISAWYASFTLTLDDQHLTLSHYGGERRIPWQDFTFFQPAEKRYPRWLVLLTLLSALTARGSEQAGAAGRAALAVSSINYGARLHHRDGSYLDIWKTNALGGLILRGAYKLESMLQQFGVKENPEKVVDYTLSFASKSGDGRARKQWRSTGIALMVFGLFVLASFHHTNQSMQQALAFAPADGEEQETEFPEPEYPEFGGLAAVEAEAAWMEIFGGDLRDFGASSIMNRDGEYITAGATSSFGSFSPVLYLVAADENGELLWETTHQVPQDCNPSCIIQTADGGYAVTVTAGDYSSRRAYLIKTDSQGELEWRKGASREERSSGLSLVENSQGELIVAGNRGDHSFLQKTDPAGEEKWQTTLGIDWSASNANQVLLLPGEGYLVIGSVLNAGATYWDVYLARVDTDGSIEWERTYGETGEERGRAGVLLENGDVIITGYKKSEQAAFEEVYLLAVDREGEMLWENTYPSPEHDGNGIAIQQRPGGGYLVLANSFHPSLYTRASLLLVDSQGELEAVQRLWDEGNIRAYSVNPAEEGAFVVTGMIEDQSGTGVGRSMFLTKVKAD